MGDHGVRLPTLMLTFIPLLVPARRCQGRWYLCDDSWVGEATEEAVRGCQAFQLFYSRADVGDAC